jgi:HD-GYP domain-containing protein (c-di-GMP phosphodiesterase class II)
MPHWAEARTYIYQYHECPDGSGYPKGLTNDEISDGAKILALVDAFEAMTHKRASKTHQIRPVTHALLEINRASGTQFCPFWVDILNQVMKSILLNKG